MVRQISPITINGFTLIELSIVLVIIGLIVGGVLVGRDLIGAAEVRAQITQIEKYNTAVNTFRGKFNALPGDMTAATAQQFGFAVTADAAPGSAGHRNGDGILQSSNSWTLGQGQCETAFFWGDLSSPVAGKLMDGQFPNGSAAAFTCISTPDIVSGTGVGQIFPAAKIGHGNYVYAYSISGTNWFGVSAVTSIDSSSTMYSNANIPVVQAYKMDVKVDDGNPTTGNIQATYIGGTVAALQLAPWSSTAGGTTSSCYDTSTNLYSITINNGNGGNCALSFKMQ